LWCGEKEEKKNERSDDDVGRCGEKRKEKKKEEERNLMYLGLRYFGAVFEFLLKC
jgi:hypothetical protein